MIFPTMWYARPAQHQISLRIPILEYAMTIKLLMEHHLEFLSLKGGCTSLSVYTLVKMPHCWKSHVAAQTYSKAWCIDGYSTKFVAYSIEYRYLVFCALILAYCKKPIFHDFNQPFFIIVYRIGSSF